MKEGQLIHESVFEEMKRASYTPAARIYEGIWDKDKKKMLEEDPYTNASAVLSKIAKYTVEEKLAAEDIHAINGLRTTGKYYRFLG